MINYIYQLVSPKVFSVKYEELNFDDNVIIKPEYMAICHADQRYYLGQRDAEILQKKLPMALIHEACGKVVYDPSGRLKAGDTVVMIPNVPAEHEEYIYENYAKGSKFLSSGYDGFFREYVDMPMDRIVSAQGVPERVVAITEFISVAVHATARMDKMAHVNRKRIGIWGDGSLAFVVANVVKKIFPQSKLIIVGKNVRKLLYFSFADETYLKDEISENFMVDHAFECCGGVGSGYAIDDIIKYINPQGTVVLMGVSEHKIAVNTRDILEKGLTFVGSSRSGKVDFEDAIEMLRDPIFRQRIEQIIYEDEEVSSIDDIHRVFQTDLNTPFKTVFHWNM